MFFIFYMKYSDEGHIGSIISIIGPCLLFEIFNILLSDFTPAVHFNADICWLYSSLVQPPSFPSDSKLPQSHKPLTREQVKDRQIYCWSARTIDESVIKKIEKELSVRRGSSDIDRYVARGPGAKWAKMPES